MIGSAWQTSLEVNCPCSENTDKISLKKTNMPLANGNRIHVKATKHTLNVLFIVSLFAFELTTLTILGKKTVIIACLKILVGSSINLMDKYDSEIACTQKEKVMVREIRILNCSIAAPNMPGNNSFRTSLIPDL
jgi:hypothetical protein